MYEVPLDLYQQMSTGLIAKAVADGVTTADEVARWWQQVRATAEAGCFFVTFIGFVAAGRVPGEPWTESRVSDVQQVARY